MVPIPSWRKKLLVCGTRDFDDFGLLRDTLDRLTFWFSDVIVVTGGQKLRVGYGRYAGADYLAQEWASLVYNRYTVMNFHPDREAHGKAAIPVRNKEMVEFVGSDGYCVAFWNGTSLGTKNMIQLAKEHGITTRVVRYDE